MILFWCFYLYFWVGVGTAMFIDYKLNIKINIRWLFLILVGLAWPISLRVYWVTKDL